MEIPETVPEASESFPAMNTEVPRVADIEVEYYVANYPYQSIEQGDLTFNAGEVITVIKKEGEWWTGTIDKRTGIFPSNYVQKVDMVSLIVFPYFFSLLLTRCTEFQY